MKKYILLMDDVVKTETGKILHRIKAIKSFGQVTEGDIGGIERILKTVRI